MSTHFAREMPSQLVQAGRNRSLANEIDSAAGPSLTQPVMLMVVLISSTRRRRHSSRSVVKAGCVNSASRSPA